MDRLEGIEAFALVVETGSFTAAADRLKRSKSAVSAHVQRLEERLGVQLLHRTTRRLSTTEAGATYHRYCMRILADAEAAEQAAAALHREPRGTLRVSAPDMFGWMHIMPAVATFRRRYPRIAFDLRLDERHVNLVDERLDLAIRIGALPDSPLVVRKLAASRTVLCAAPAYLDTYGTPRTPGDLTGHAGLCFPPLWHDGRWHMTSKQGGEERVPISGSVVSNSGEVLRSAALAAVGIALLPTWAIAEDLRSGALVRVLPEWSPPQSLIHAVYPDNRRMSVKVRSFVDHLVRHIGKVPYWNRPEPDERGDLPVGKLSRRA
jgi:DNA-binding transcriptional LysR family regulator